MRLLGAMWGWNSNEIYPILPFQPSNRWGGRGGMRIKSK